MAETPTAFPLYWPQKQPRAKRSARVAISPFTVGETYERTERRYESGELRERTIKAHRDKQVSIAIAVDRLEDQLERLDAQHPLLSTNLETRLNGTPRSGQKDPDDPGAAVWFTLRGKRTVLACDKWQRVADNIAALAAHIGAIRSVERYGVGTLEQAFRGYQALEDFSAGTIPWRRVLGLKDDGQITREEVESRYRELARRTHPDIAGGDSLQMAQLNLAIAEARAELNSQ
jgi:hypothetical protein